MEVSGSAAQRAQHLSCSLNLSLLHFSSLSPAVLYKLKVTILHSSGAPATSRCGSFFFFFPGGGGVSRFRVVWVPCALRCTVAQRLFHASLQENKLGIRPTKQVGRCTQPLWILWGDRVSGGRGCWAVGRLCATIHYVSI